MMGPDNDPGLNDALGKIQTIALTSYGMLSRAEQKALDNFNRCFDAQVKKRGLNPAEENFRLSVYNEIWEECLRRVRGSEEAIEKEARLADQIRLAGRDQ